jgi:hypothetical protein
MGYKSLVESYKNEFRNQTDLIKSTDKTFLNKYSNGDTEFSPPFIPGTIYYFKYNTTTEISKDRSFINRKPLVLCTDYLRGDNGSVLIGIDLITVPPFERIEIISRVYDTFNNIIESNQISLNKGGKQTPILFRNGVLERLMRGTGYSKSLFGFKLDFIDSVISLQLEDWPKIPYLRSSSIEGKNVEEIYKEYKVKLRGT